MNRWKSFAASLFSSKPSESEATAKMTDALQSPGVQYRLGLETSGQLLQELHSRSPNPHILIENGAELSTPSNDISAAPPTLPLTVQQKFQAVNWDRENTIETHKLIAMTVAERFQAVNWDGTNPPKQAAAQQVQTPTTPVERKDTSVQSFFSEVAW
ncbi:MAG: hypothetical protein EP343_12915 [Deltaproteobacteria bacterium]|nr:MAG: hypothetical protein EP343_12915 [Deltaproteobacteria bacterium]